MIKAVLSAWVGLAWGLSMPAVSALERVTPGFATCAAYYFLAARGHGVRDYDRLYSAGEFAMNQATHRHGNAAANTKMAAASGTMMKEIHQDWREIEILDQRYGASCETLLRDVQQEFR